MGRVGTGMSVKTLAMLDERLAPLANSTMPLSSHLPRRSRFGGPLALSKVHWVRPVAEINYLGWTDEPRRATVASRQTVASVEKARLKQDGAQTVPAAVAASTEGK